MVAACAEHLGFVLWGESSLVRIMCGSAVLFKKMFSFWEALLASPHPKHMKTRLLRGRFRLVEQAMAATTRGGVLVVSLMPLPCTWP